MWKKLLTRQKRDLCSTTQILCTWFELWFLLLRLSTNSFTKFPVRDDVIKWKHFPRYWPFARGIHRSPVNSPHKGQWCGALRFSLICTWIDAWVNNREAGDLKRLRAHYDVIVMGPLFKQKTQSWYMDSHSKTDTVARPSRVYNEDF